MSSPHKFEYASTTSEFCSFFNSPSSRGRVSPMSDELTHRSPWGLTIDTAFEDCDSHDDGCTFSSSSTLCAALGLSTPNSPRSPTSPSFKSFTPDSPRYGLNGFGNGFGNVFGNGTRCSAETHPAGENMPKSSVEHIETDRKGPTVFVWDLDETLIIFQTLLDGRYVELFDGFKDTHKATLLGRRWETLILEVCDDYFFYNHVEEYNHSNVNSLQEYDDGADLSDFKFDDILKPPLNADNLRNIRYLHRYISQLYEQGLDTLLTPEQDKEWHDLYEATDSFTDGWLSAGREKLEELQKVNEQKLQEIKISSDGSVKSSSAPNSYNFLVTSGTLIPSLVKCMLFKLSPYFNASNIYSSREVGKLQCCRWIRDRFSHSEKLPKFCSIGDGPDEREAARVLAWPFVNISIDPDAPGQLPLLSYKTVKVHIKAVYRDNADISKEQQHIRI
ncbi:hypothetical protein KC19_2G079200 [Ceratodon purpureus]|uniref:protein-tyrosine-phosphatase n=1 Tax=Ceratodon purpureus TaxID=3225 RepID=A0A8T0IT34_CERPU|nr:hypothetical protein KC19_2G079200 [Ceratodon purpureus]